LQTPPEPLYSLVNIRAEAWLKLSGNVTFNPISALSHATVVDICEFPLSRALAASLMSEAHAVGKMLDITFRVSLAKRIAGAEKVGKHKTSMLQDIEPGRARHRRIGWLSGGACASG
jgi:2-dehydropantoate 2-reductase